MQRYYKIKLCSLLVSSSFYQLSWSVSPPPLYTVFRLRWWNFRPCSKVGGLTAEYLATCSLAVETFILSCFSVITWSKRIPNFNQPGPSLTLEFASAAKDKSFVTLADHELFCQWSCMISIWTATSKRTCKQLWSYHWKTGEQKYFSTVCLVLLFLNNATRLHKTYS